MRIFLAFVVTVLVFVIAPVISNASKGDMAVRKEFGTFEEANYDEPYRATAVVEGRCRDVKVPASDSRMIRYLYRVNEKDTGEKIKLEAVGVVYFNERGQEAVCFNDLALQPFVEKNVCGEIVSIIGWVTLGRDYGIEREKVVIVDSMDLLGDILEK